MADVTPDPEVERLADAMALTDCGVPGCGALRMEAERVAAAVLADLRERYILVPRDGAEEREEWGVRTDGSDYIGHAVDRDHAEQLAATVRRGWDVIHRRGVFGPWEPAP